MTKNHYKTPDSEIGNSPLIREKNETRLNLLSVGQKMMIYGIIIEFSSLALINFLPYLVGVVIAVGLMITLAGIILVYYILEFHVAAKILYLLLLFVPLINLLVILSLNSRATKMLKEAGYTIGFFGAKPPK
ncbi:MAG: hypothetical protein OEY96_07375 [Gammaproteobacteria bacterium]|nr:hypothetical protein [Gammaproteobacteria bacterium]